MAARRESTSPSRAAAAAGRSPSPSQRKKSALQSILRPVSPGSWAAQKGAVPTNIRKNNHGGVYVTSEEVQLAFNMLEPDKQGQVSMANLKKKLGPMFPELSVKDYRFLMNDKKDLSLEDLKDMLLDNDITNYDPVGEAFKVFASASDAGQFNGDKLREVFIAYGFGELSDEELDILTRIADVDGDGHISQDDFRSMVVSAAVPPQSQGGGSPKKRLSQVGQL